jgi:hypothetical protein
MHVRHSTEALPQNRSRRGQAISITPSECLIVALLIQHAMRMRRIILVSVACLVLIIFFHIKNGKIK